MTATATETHTLVTTDGKPQITRAATKTTVTKPPAKPTVTEDTTKGAKLETIALRLRNQAVTSAVKLAETFVAMYPYAPWEGHQDANGHVLTVTAYFRDVMGISADNFKLPMDARRRLVKGMFDRDNNPDLILDIAAMAGASDRTIARDRSELGFANENRVEAHTKPQTDNNETDNGDDTDKPAKSKTKVTTVNVIAIVDTMSDTQYLMQVIAHASARITELNTPKA